MSATRQLEDLHVTSRPSTLVEALDALPAPSERGGTERFFQWRALVREARA